jgi:hypothetical protein
MHDLENILLKFEKIVSPKFCNDLARECRLVQRSSSRLQGFEFAQTMMIPNAFLEAETLTSLSVRMRRINKTCDLSAPALAQRINTKMAQSFMRTCFGTVIKEIVKQDFTTISDLDDLRGFNRILIQDSTRVELHEKLSTLFKGSGGVASKASVKIDFIFDYLSEEIVSIDFFSGNKPDQSLAININSLLKENDLIVRDLGYFAVKRLQEIDMLGAYFISRWRVDEHIYENKDAKEPLDLAKFLDKHLYKGLVDTELFVGQNRQSVRLIACLMDEEAVQKRLRAANRSASRHGTQVSKKKAALLRFSIFITNVPSEILSTTSVMAVYRARWRVELIFKQWKSCLKLHVFKGFNLERFHCLLYGRLIMILLLGSIYPILMRYGQEYGRELSGYRLTNYLIADDSLPRAIQKGVIEEYIKQLLVDLPRRLCMEKRKRPSLRNNVKMSRGYYKSGNKPLNTKFDLA